MVCQFDSYNDLLPEKLKCMSHTSRYLKKHMLNKALLKRLKVIHTFGLIRYDFFTQQDFSNDIIMAITNENKDKSIRIILKKFCNIAISVAITQVT